MFSASLLTIRFRVLLLADLFSELAANDAKKTHCAK